MKLTQTQLESIYAYQVVGSLQEEASSKNIKAFLGGGFLRDLVLGEPERARDLDLYLEGEEAECQQVFNSTIGRLKSFNLQEELPFDFACSENIARRVQQYDFTCHGLLHELGSDQVIDTSTGIHDLETKLLRFANSSFFLSSPGAFVRAFRFKASRNFRLDSSIIEAIKGRAGLIALLSERERGKTFFEFLHFLSISKASKDLELFSQLGLLDAMLPLALYKSEVLPLEGKFKLCAMLENSSSWSEELSKIETRSLMAKNESFRISRSALGMLRLAILGAGAGLSLLSGDSAFDASLSREMPANLFSSRLWKSYLSTLPIPQAIDRDFRVVALLSLKIEDYLQGDDKFDTKNPLEKILKEVLTRGFQ